MRLTIVNELVKHKEVLSIKMKWDLVAVAVVFRTQEEFHDDSFGSFALDMDLDVERLVIHTRALD